MYCCHIIKVVEGGLFDEVNVSIVMVIQQWFSGEKWWKRDFFFFFFVCGVKLFVSS